MPGPDQRHGQPGSPALVTRGAGINQTLAYDRLLDSLLRRLPVVVGVGPVGAGELASSNHLVTYTVDVVEQVVLETNHTGNHVNEVQEDLDLGVAASRVLLLNDAANPCNVSSSVDPAEALAANGLFAASKSSGTQTPVMCVRVMCTCAPYWKTPSGRVNVSLRLHSYLHRGDAATVLGDEPRPPSASACTHGNVSDEPRAPPSRRRHRLPFRPRASSSDFDFHPGRVCIKSTRRRTTPKIMSLSSSPPRHQQRYGSFYGPRRRPRPQ